MHVTLFNRITDAKSRQELNPRTSCVRKFQTIPRNFAKARKKEPVSSGGVLLMLREEDVLLLSISKSKLPENLG